MIFFWHVDMMIWQVDLNNWQVNIKIWKVNIEIWQEIAEINHRTFLSYYIHVHVYVRFAIL